MRYIIGVDLGTTNSCVAYVDTDVSNPTLSIRQFKIPQLISGFRLSSLSVLPSFCYLSAKGEFGSEALVMPWSGPSDYLVGSLAQDLGEKFLLAWCIRLKVGSVILLSTAKTEYCRLMPKILSA